MRSLSKVFAGALVAAFVLAGCASTPSEESGMSFGELLVSKGYRIGDPVSRVSNWRMDSWNYLDDEHLIIRSGVSRYYLITLRNRCADLSSAVRIGFTNTVGALTVHDQVIVRGPGDWVDRCMIESLHELHKVDKETNA